MGQRRREEHSQSAPYTSYWKGEPFRARNPDWPTPPFAYAPAIKYRVATSMVSSLQRSVGLSLLRLGGESVVAELFGTKKRVVRQ